jgi:hypothetical protein
MCFVSLPAISSSWRANVCPRRVELATPEGSLFRIEITALSADCPNERAQVIRSLEASLRVAALQEVGSHVHAAISSAGHGFELELPPGFYVVSAGGMSDQYETAYQIRGPEGAWVTLYTSWRNPSSAAGPLVPNLLGQRVRWRSGVVDLGTEVEGCRSTLALGPDKRLKVELIMCGPEQGYAELEQLLRSVRLKAP